MAAFSRGRTVVNSLRVFWVLVILWYEVWTWDASVRSCKWPDSALLADNLGVEASHSKPTHVLLVADPQIIDRHSYPSRGLVLSYITQFLVDLNLRKNWRTALYKKPDVVVFLGDMMDSGRFVMTDEEYSEYFSRFNKIFTLNVDIPVYFIPGNHDVGLGAKITQFSDVARARYIEHFGQPNQEISVANHTLVLFDAPSYADEDSQRHGQKKSFERWDPVPYGALDFMKKFPSRPHPDPVILLSHIPLFRSDGRSCGPLREKGTIRPGVGLGYQNTLEKQSSLRLLEFLTPTVVYSGDDHDYCEYTHVYQHGGVEKMVREVTVKSLSMVMNVRRPGFQLLSLMPTNIRASDKPTYADAPCLLPDQLGIYLVVYIPLLAISLVIVLASNMGQQAPRRYRQSFSNDDVEAEGRRDTYPPTSSGQGPSPGWFVIQDHRRQQNTSISNNWPGKLKDLLGLLYSGNSRFASYRRTWPGIVIADVRDIAIFPLLTFVLTTWWVTSH
ncbi:Cell division control protein 1 [Psilocybe cubensis]|uniref:Calcineurin-like phosphoesterase domain-containing protein n=2 Tax=Psilocybe cubensis TaxID=181762 RepID=A0A8H8CNZ7_PSICU|nr:Cell division control protein 1 [Psilocybe cubensis]KAH9485032.1 Cell division control protein 1 [Psilocybe cubensis]